MNISPEDLRELPSDIIEKILLNIEPEEIKPLCIKSELYHDLACINPIYWRKWVNLPVDEIRKMINNGTIENYYLEMKYKNDKKNIEKVMNEWKRAYNQSEEERKSRIEKDEKDKKVKKKVIFYEDTRLGPKEVEVEIEI